MLLGSKFTDLGSHKCFRVIKIPTVTYIWVNRTVVKNAFNIHNPNNINRAPRWFNDKPARLIWDR